LKEEGRRKKEEGRRKKEEGRRKKEEGRGKKEEGRRKNFFLFHLSLIFVHFSSSCLLDNEG